GVGARPLPDGGGDRDGAEADGDASADLRRGRHREGPGRRHEFVAPAAEPGGPGEAMTQA
ncbi:hypothetical protein, partial [Nocardiopsis sp. NPDC055824]